MKRMLIIGSQYPGIISVGWSEVTTINITDYQLLLIDLNDFPESGGYNNPEWKPFKDGIESLWHKGYPIVFILPRKRSPFFINFFSWNFWVENKSGVTINFDESDEIIQFYKNLMTKHEIILRKHGEGNFFSATSKFRMTDTKYLIWNNIDEPCSLKAGSLYLLHPPDINCYRKAIEGLINYFSPDFEEVIEEKPQWARDYELSELGLQIKEDQIIEIEREINKLNEKKNIMLNEKEQIAKWSDLITVQGRTLEIRLKEAFELVGIENIKQEPFGVHGPDLIIEHKSLGFTIEIEGSKGPIRIDKARQLLHWIADAPIEYKGVLIGNPFRELPPDARPPKNNRLFVKEAVELALKRDFALITSYEIFRLVCKKLKGEKIDIEKILDNIFHNKGEISLT